MWREQDRRLALQVEEKELRGSQALQKMQSWVDEEWPPPLSHTKGHRPSVFRGGWTGGDCAAWPHYRAHATSVLGWLSEE